MNQNYPKKYHVLANRRMPPGAHPGQGSLIGRDRGNSNRHQKNSPLRNKTTRSKEQGTVAASRPLSNALTLYDKRTICFSTASRGATPFALRPVVLRSQDSRPVRAWQPQTHEMPPVVRDTDSQNQTHTLLQPSGLESVLPLPSDHPSLATPFGSHSSPQQIHTDATAYDKRATVQKRRDCSGPQNGLARYRQKRRSEYSQYNRLRGDLCRPVARPPVPLRLALVNT